MYLKETKTLLTTAMRSAFETGVVNDADFANLRVGIEYPMKAQDYPSIWVDYEPEGPLETAGIGHIEYGEDSPFTRAYRWKFRGSVTYTIVALTSLERDRLFDEAVKLVAFSEATVNLGTFREQVELNPLIALAMNFDQIQQRGFGAAQGTPWGTDEMVYEATVSLDVMGEFVSSPEGALLPISGFVVIPIAEGEDDPTTEGGWIG